MTRHRLLTTADYRRTPWRNGAGRTAEVASHPPGAALDRFDWRVSVVIGLLPQIAPKKHGVLRVWQGGMWRRGRPI